MMMFLFPFALGKKKFSFRGCGWKAVNATNWSQEHRDWILAIDNLFTQLFGEVFLRYVYDKDKGTSVDEHIVSTLVEYSHDQWESVYLNQQTAAQQDTPATGRGPNYLAFADTSPKAPKKMFLGSQTPQEKVIILDEEDDTEN